MSDNHSPKKRGRKAFWWFICIMLVLLTGFVYFRYYFVFSTGVRAGELNYVVHKGILFKTFEGKLIQTGFRADLPGGLQSNQFVFSVKDEEIARQLMVASGHNVQLHYREYFGRLPWRGHTRFIVDSIVSIQPRDPHQEVIPFVLE